MTTRTEYQIARMTDLAKSFGVDLTPAQQLTGQELDTWLNQQEDLLFAQGLQDLAAMRVERERGYRVAA